MALLEGRGLELTTAQHDRIETCVDAAVLERWLDQAKRAVRSDDVFFST